ncbi:hypothetical protein ACFSTC_28500 [Nonomuraea ferruginea]
MSYLALGLLWALGGPGYPFDAGRPGPGNTLLDPLAPAVGGSVLAVSALVAERRRRARRQGPLTRAAAVVAVVAGARPGGAPAGRAHHDDGRVPAGDARRRARSARPSSR